jgi:hypothetical protein
VLLCCCIVSCVARDQFVLRRALLVLVCPTQSHPGSVSRPCRVDSNNQIPLNNYLQIEAHAAHDDNWNALLRTSDGRRVEEQQVHVCSMEHEAC